LDYDAGRRYSKLRQDARALTTARGLTLADWLILPLSTRVVCALTDARLQWPECSLRPAYDRIAIGFQLAVAA
jgi:hypothetical protein